MFTTVRLHGRDASILWGYHPAVTFRSWSIAKEQGQWTLRGTAMRVENFMTRQRPLLFTAPRPKGQWAWGIESLQITGASVFARLGPPEQ